MSPVVTESNLNLFNGSNLIVKCNLKMAGFPYTHVLNKTTRMPFEILFVTLVGATAFPPVLGVQCLHESEKTTTYSSRCIQLTCLGEPAFTLSSRFFKNYQISTIPKIKCYTRSLNIDECVFPLMASSLLYTC